MAISPVAVRSARIDWTVDQSTESRYSLAGCFISALGGQTLMAPTDRRRVAKGYSSDARAKRGTSCRTAARWSSRGTAAVRPPASRGSRTGHEQTADDFLSEYR